MTKKSFLQLIFFSLLVLGFLSVGQLVLAEECSEGEIQSCGTCGTKTCECNETVCDWSSSCQKKATAGPCCDDDGQYKPASTVCGTESRNQYKCEKNEEDEFFCGNKILARKREKDQYCPGDSDSCTGHWSEWKTVSSREEKCQVWQKCKNGDWTTTKLECKCAGECLAAPQNPRYYDNPEYPIDPFSPEESKNPYDIYLPVKFDWDDVPGWKDGWKEDETIKTCSTHCVKSYVIRIDNTSLTNKVVTASEYNLRQDQGACFLESGRDYNWHVKACCAIDGKDCGPEPEENWQIKTNLAPELIEPDDPDWVGEERGEPIWEEQSEENPKPVSFQWCPVREAQSYSLQAYKDGKPYCPDLYCPKETDPIIIRKSTKEPINILVPGIDFGLDSFTKETNCSWQVATCLADEGKNCKEYSQEWKFFGSVTLPQVKLVLPKDKDFVNLSHFLRWEHIPGAKSYRYKLSGSSSIPVFEFISLRKLWNEGKLKLDTEYSWQVQLCLEEGGEKCQEESWSEEWKFTTTGRKLEEEELNTDNTIIPVKLDWEDIPGALSYKYEVYEMVDSSAQKIVDELIFYIAKTPPSEILIDYPTLKQERDYSWRVKTCADEEGKVCGAWSDFQDFRTFKLATTTPHHPSEENPNFYASENYISWHSVLGAKFYEYKIKYLFASEEEKSENCLASLEEEERIKIVSAAPSKITSAFVDDLKCLGEYQWQVRACLDKDCQETGDWSDSWHFSLIGVPEKNGLVPCGKNYDNPNTPWDERESCQIKHLFILFRNILDLLLWRVSLIVLLLLTLATAGIYYMSIGRADIIIDIRSLWKSVATGYAIIFFAWTIINFFLRIFGITTEWWVFPF